MSSIIAFRQKVMDRIREKIAGVEEVEWYDGMFDADDIADWSLHTPCCVVSAMNVTKSNTHSTGQLNADLRMLVVTIVQDGHSPRDADAICWRIIEDIAILAQHNDFDDPNAGVSSNIKFKRLSIPAMRREGIALGVTEWDTTLTVGRKTYETHLYVDDPATGERITQTPPNLTGAATLSVDLSDCFGPNISASEREILMLTEDEE